MESLKVIQHNVLRWRTRRHELSNIYRHANADILLINSHGVLSNESLKIPGYKTHTKIRQTHTQTARQY